MPEVQTINLNGKQIEIIDQYAREQIEILEGSIENKINEAINVAMNEEY